MYTCLHCSSLALFLSCLPGLRESVCVCGGLFRFALEGGGEVEKRWRWRWREEKQGENSDIHSFTHSFVRSFLQNQTLDPIQFNSIPTTHPLLFPYVFPFFFFFAASREIRHTDKHTNTHTDNRLTTTPLLAPRTIDRRPSSRQPDAPSPNGARAEHRRVSSGAVSFAQYNMIWGGVGVGVGRQRETETDRERNKPQHIRHDKEPNMRAADVHLVKMRHAPVARRHRDVFELHVHVVLGWHGESAIVPSVRGNRGGGNHLQSASRGRSGPTSARGCIHGPRHRRQCAIWRLRFYFLFIFFLSRREGRRGGGGVPPGPRSAT